MKWFVVLIVVAALAVAALLAFGPRGTGGAGTADLIILAGDDLHDFDPQRSSWMVDFRVLECLFETLLRTELPSTDVGLGTAQRYEVSPDGLTYTFHIRPDAVWSNGDPVRASDYIFAWRRAMIPDLSAQYTNLVFNIAGAKGFFDWRVEQLKRYGKSPTRSEKAARDLWDEAVEQFNQTVGLRAPDARTLVVTLANPTAYFPELAAFATFSPLHEKSVERFVTYNAQTGHLAMDAAWVRPANLVCNGPYVLAERSVKQRILLLANPHYWNRAAMQNQSIRIDIIENPQTAFLAYKDPDAGVDWWPDLPSGDPLAADLVAQQRPDLHPYPSAGTYFYLFNCNPTLPDGRPNPFTDARVRRAFSMTIDRQTIVDNITRLHQPVARTFVPPDAFTDYMPPVEAGATYDPQGARKLLAEAGYPGGKGLERLTLMFNKDAGHDKIAEFVMNTWQRELGVRVEPVVQSTKVFGDFRRSQKFIIARGNWFGDYRDPTTFLDMYISHDGNNDAKWSNAEYDQLMAEAARTADAAGRLEILRRAETLLMQEQPLAPMFYYVQFHMYDPQRIAGVFPNAWNYRRLEFVKVARPK
ncbi:MAG: peptide ABC transporter substrate-binding protein [Phycisphaeraceae bacterium]